MDDFSSLSKENSQDRIHPEETICLRLRQWFWAGPGFVFLPEVWIFPF